MNLREAETELAYEAMHVLDALPYSGNCTFTLRNTLTPACPVDGALDEYEATIEYQARKRAIDAYTVEPFFDLFDGLEISQEDCTTLIARIITTHYDPEWVRVTLIGEHDGTEMETVEEL